MSDSDDTRLPEQAEALLEKWPDAERDAAAWDALAEKIDAKVAKAQVGLTEDELLDPPLPETDEDGAQDDPPVAPEVAKPAPDEERQSLAEMARQVADKKEDDSLSSIAAASLSMAARDSRPSLDEIRQSAPSIDEIEEVEAKSEASAAPPPVAEVVPLAAHPAPVSTAQPSSGRTGMLVGVVAVAVGIAAATVIYLRGQSPPGGSGGAAHPGRERRPGSHASGGAEEAPPRRNPARRSSICRSFPPASPAPSPSRRPEPRAGARRRRRRGRPRPSQRKSPPRPIPRSPQRRSKRSTPTTRR